jgi:hypothetical protein
MGAAGSDSTPLNIDTKEAIVFFYFKLRYKCMIKSLDIDVYLKKVEDILREHSAAVIS